MQKSFLVLFSSMMALFAFQPINIASSVEISEGDVTGSSPDQAQIFFVGGICDTPEQHAQATNAIANTFDKSVAGIYNDTSSLIVCSMDTSSSSNSLITQLTSDILQYTRRLENTTYNNGLLKHHRNPAVVSLVQQIRNRLTIEVDVSFKLQILAYSQGATLTALALQELQQDAAFWAAYNSRITVLTLGGASRQEDFPAGPAYEHHINMGIHSWFNTGDDSVTALLGVLYQSPIAGHTIKNFYRSTSRNIASCGQERFININHALCAYLDNLEGLQSKIVSGRVVGSTGSPIAGAEVYSDSSGIGTRTNTNGEFTLSHIPTGENTLTAYHSQHGSNFIPLQVTATATTIIAPDITLNGLLCDVTSCTQPPACVEMNFLTQGNGQIFSYPYASLGCLDHSYIAGTQITLAGLSSDDWSFNRWEGTEGSKIASYTVNNPTTLTAVFEQKPIPQVDLVFVFDTTASMWDDIAAVKAAATSLTSQFFGTGKDIRIAIVLYRDQGDIYVATIHLDFSNDPTTIVNSINTITVDGGGDFPEAVYSGLMTAIGLTWRPDAQKAIILMGDAPPKDPEPITNYTLDQVFLSAADTNTTNGGLISTSIIVIPPLSDSLPTSSIFANPSSIKIFPIHIGTAPDTRVAFENIAAGTEGKLFTAAAAVGVVDAITEAMSNIISTEPLERIEPLDFSQVNLGVNTFQWGYDAQTEWYDLWVVGKDGFIFHQWYPATNADGLQYGQRGVCNGIACTVEAPALINGIYDWWISTWNSEKGMGEYELSTFNINAPSLEAIIQRTPAKDSVISSASARLDWFKNPNAMWYEVWLVGSNGDTFHQWYPQQTTTGIRGICDDQICSVPLPSSLKDQLYTWRLSAWNPAGNSPYSDQNFEVNLNIPGEITRLPPENTPHISLKWNPDSNALRYHLYITGEDNFIIDKKVDSSAVCSAEICIWQPDYMPNGHYEWWIAGEGSEGIGPYGVSPFIFDINLNIPLQVEIIYPSANATIPAGIINFQWQADNNFAWFHLVIKDTDEVIHDSWYDSREVCNTEQCSIELYVGDKGSYTLQMQGWNPGGLSEEITQDLTLN